MLGKKGIGFVNTQLDKKTLQMLLEEVCANYGSVKTAVIGDKIRDLGFGAATKSGLSLCVNDFRVPSRVGTTLIRERCLKNESLKRHKNAMTRWNQVNTAVKNDMVYYLRETDPLHPLYVMSFSGARGSLAQVRQIILMRGFMLDYKKNIMSLCIRSSFFEGLSIPEFITSAYGARKGLVDTALRTADAGYLSRRLIDIAHHVIIREEDCRTIEGLTYYPLEFITKKLHDYNLVGRLLAEDLTLPAEAEDLTLPAEDKIFRRNTIINHSVLKDLKKIKNKKINFKVVIKSPLTCKSSLLSCCKKCYGSLIGTPSKLVDLGESIGILAAQSIGEPGTQLILRTFHTGGALGTADTAWTQEHPLLAAPFAGIIKYNSTIKCIKKLISGRFSLILLEDLTIYIEGYKSTHCHCTLPKGAILLISNYAKVRTDQALALESKNDTKIKYNSYRKKVSESQGQTWIPKAGLASNSFQKRLGTLWVLAASRQVIVPTKKKIMNKYSGSVSFDDLFQKQEIQIINVKYPLNNCFITKYSNFKIIKFQHLRRKKFRLMIKENEEFKHGQKIAYEKQDSKYKTETGGIIYYSSNSSGSKNENFLYWVPEQTIPIRPFDLQNLEVPNGCFIKKGTKITSYPLCFNNTFATVNGYVQINYKNSEVIIKPGEVYPIKNLKIRKINRFTYPGEKLFSNEFFISRLSYLDSINIKGIKYVFLRPVQIYKLYNEKFILKKSLEMSYVNIKYRQKCYYKHHQKIKSSKGVNLLEKVIIVNINNYKFQSLNLKLRYISSLELKNKCKVKLVLYEQIKVLKSKNVIFKRQIKNHQYVGVNTILGQLEHKQKKINNIILDIKKQKANKYEIIFVKNSFLRTYLINKTEEKIYVKKGDMIHEGNQLTSKTQSQYNGQIFEITEHVIIIRIGIPYFIDSTSALSVVNREFIKNGETLFYERAQRPAQYKETPKLGIDKIVRFFEARRPTPGSACILAPNNGPVRISQRIVKGKRVKDKKGRFLKPLKKLKSYYTDIWVHNLKVSRPYGQMPRLKIVNHNKVIVGERLSEGEVCFHEKLSIFFRYFSTKYSFYEAAKKSFRQIGEDLLYVIQGYYVQEGMSILDKHLEIVLKQMISKVAVVDGGSTSLLPGELFELSKAAMLQDISLSVDRIPVKFEPILLGITRASLISDSFIAAASFQQTTQVLLTAAIEGKKDWLRGLKENVIIGRLMPAGTGFSEKKELVKRRKRIKDSYDEGSYSRKQIKKYIFKTIKN